MQGGTKQERVRHQEEGIMRAKDLEGKISNRAIALWDLGDGKNPRKSIQVPGYWVVFLKFKVKTSFYEILQVVMVVLLQVVMVVRWSPESRPSLNGT